LLAVHVCSVCKGGGKIEGLVLSLYVRFL